MRAALAASNGVDLVDDHTLKADQGLSGPAGEHQEQGLRRCDEDVGRIAHKSSALSGRRVASAHADGRLAHGLAEALCRVADAEQRRAQVLLHVDGQRPQW